MYCTFTLVSSDPEARMLLNGCTCTTEQLERCPCSERAAEEAQTARFQPPLCLLVSDSVCRGVGCREGGEPTFARCEVENLDAATLGASNNHILCRRECYTLDRLLMATQALSPKRYSHKSG